MIPKVYFVSGVCGVGKSSIMPYLKELLPADSFDVRDFDERGVPDDADSNWRKEETKKWLEIATNSAKRGVSTIVCGFAKKKDFKGIVPEDSPEIEIILLDADPKTIRTRLTGRYSRDGVFDDSIEVIGKPVTEFIDDNVYYCDVMRKECAADGCKIIDTSTLTPYEVAQSVVGLIK